MDAQIGMGTSRGEGIATKEMQERGKGGQETGENSTGSSMRYGTCT